MAAVTWPPTATSTKICPIGYIPIDSIHSPVRKVNYAVEAARLGQMTDYEKLTLEVWTNAAITPQDAIGLASKLVKDHMSIFINFEETPGSAGRSRRELTAILAWNSWTAPSKSSSFPSAPTIA